MLDAITAAQVAMAQDQLRLQSINQNISNMNTVGYKREILETSAFDHYMEYTHAHAQGPLVQTRNAHDFALTGNGFFEVQTDQGVFYTRRGDFHVNQTGALVTATGAALSGLNGAIHLDDSAFSVNSEGIISINDQPIEQFKIVYFKDTQSLRYLGQGLYASDTTPLLANSSAENRSHVMQGFIEQSNVKSVDEMMELIKTSRHFESSQRVMRARNNLLSTAISQLGVRNFAS